MGEKKPRKTDRKNNNREDERRTHGPVFTSPHPTWSPPIPSEAEEAATHSKIASIVAARRAEQDGHPERMMVKNSWTGDVVTRAVFNEYVLARQAQIRDGVIRPGGQIAIAAETAPDKDIPQAPNQEVGLSGQLV